MRTKKLTESVSWIGRCHESARGHTHLSQYVVTGAQNVLIDAGQGDTGELIQTVYSLTDGEPVDFLFLTHSVLPHTGNVRVLREEWPEMDVVASAAIGELVGLPNTEPKVVNATQTLAGREFTFLDPLLTDATNSNWIYDRAAETLFTAEGIGHYHAPSDCSKISTELPGGVSFHKIHAFHKDKLAYLRCVDPQKLRAGFDALIDEFDPRYIAPMHGNPIVREDLTDHLDNIIRSVEVLRNDH